MSKIVFFIVSINYCYFQVRGRLNHLKSTPASRICLIMSGLGEKNDPTKSDGSDQSWRGLIGKLRV